MMEGKGKGKWHAIEALYEKPMAEVLIGLFGHYKRRWKVAYVLGVSKNTVDDWLCRCDLQPNASPINELDDCAAGDAADGAASRARNSFGIKR